MTVVAINGVERVEKVRTAVDKEKAASHRPGEENGNFKEKIKNLGE